MVYRSLTREQMAAMYGWTRKTFVKKVSAASIMLPPGVITPKYVEIIIEKLGTPPYYNQVLGFSSKS